MQMLYDQTLEPQRKVTINYLTELEIDQHFNSRLQKILLAHFGGVNIIFLCL